ncbi:IS91 family transposase [Arenibacter latericius]|uniref:IS91 family transposase n=1 Tax=Arenibacter latericius TaxID=86104 RepID=UPI0004133DD4|nr:IS91 family transposase [Arenibacter latericius]
MKPVYEVAQVLEGNREQLVGICANSWQLRTLHALRKCRTASLGGHIDRCNNPSCHRLHLSYNSCRNRHCPKCQGHKKKEWIRAREEELLNVPYFHVVFTLPSALNRLCLYEPKLIYSLLFKISWQVVQGFASNHKFMGATPGMIAILHTWGQNLSLHPHLHCIVPGGGIAQSGKWKYAKNKGKYLFPVKAMSMVFRARFVASLRKEFPPQPTAFYENLFKHNWVVYCKRPFLGPAQVVEYLGRYTHKIAISNHRIKSLDTNGVTFTVKDYRNGGRKRLLRLDDAEFIRRFTLHILPKGFIRIRHYGILSSTKKRELLPLLQQVLGRPVNHERPPLKHRRCPYCQIGIMVTVAVFDSRGPPKAWSDKLKKYAPGTTLQKA